jgi:hypothetical protein
MGKRLQGLNATYLNLVFWRYNGAMSRKILSVLVGVGVAGAAFATQACAEDGSHISREKLGLIPGTMAHLKDVRLTAVPKLPDYIINNDNMQKWQQEPALINMMYDSVTPLDVMVQYPPAD